MLVLSVALGAGHTAFPGEWRKDADNPVFGNRLIGTCFDANVITNGTVPYTMYFSWRRLKSIAVVKSHDGQGWSWIPRRCLCPDPSSGWEDDVNRSCTVFKDGVWHMWYTGQAKGASRIGYARSTDGVRFTRVRASPVLIPEKPFEKPSVMNPYVVWEASRKIWRMWYSAGETAEPNVLCYAESSDGLQWTKYSGNPIFEKGPVGSWDCDRVGGCEVHRLQDGRYCLFYIGYSDISSAKIGCAFSNDGISRWRRYERNPIVSPDVGQWDGDACYKPTVAYDMTSRRWMLWYNGRKGGREYIGLAVCEGPEFWKP